MATSKVIKEIVTDVGGNTTIEYSDDTTQKYNVADVVTAQSNPLTGRIGLFSAGSQLPTELGYSPLVAAIGDSRIAQGRRAGTGGGYELRTDGATNWLEPLMQGRVRHPADYYLALSGSGYAHILATQIPALALLNPRPTHCVILSATNDIGNAVAMSTIKANILLVWAQVRAIGIIPVHILDLPRTVASWSAANAKQRLDLNNWIAANAQANGAVYVDPNGGYVDQSNANGDPLSGFNQADGIHPTSKGAYQVGLALKRYFDTVATPNIIRPSSILDVYDATYNPRGNGILLGGTMSGSAGTNSGTGASGPVATNFNNRVLTGTATAVSSLVARTDAAGWWDQVVYTATTLSTFRFGHAATAANVTVGDTVYAAIDLVITSSLLDYIQFLVFSNPGTGQATVFKGTGTYPMTDMNAVQVRLITPPFIIGATATDIIFRLDSQIEAGGSATIRYGACEIRKVISGTA